VPSLVVKEVMVDPSEYAVMAPLLVRASLARNPSDPLARVAAFLLSLAAISGNEGRDPSIVAESTSCGLVADCLTMSLDMLSSCLIELEHRGLIEPRLPTGLRLKDFAALEAVAGGLSSERRTVERYARARFLAVDYREVL
jgi:hypothetical protein